MSDSTTIASEQLDYPFLLVTHMVCADQQIHSEESKALRELADQVRIGQGSLDEVEKILAQDEQHLSVEDVARSIPPGQQSEAMRQILALAYIDGFFSPLEREMIEQVAGIWQWTAEEIQQLIQEAEGFTANRSVNNDNKQAELSVGARLLKRAESILSRSLVTKLVEIAPENIRRNVKQGQREILLAGSEYDEAIGRCAAVATEDYKFAEVALKGAGLALTNLGRNIQQAIEEIKGKASSKGQATTAKEVAKQLENTKKALTTEIIKEIEGLRESLNAKQRALNHFSIAFMGKTKAGKSTLHAIITGEGWDAIGVGKQRTTRFNRVYEWKNIRIIDTPGIGAPGGKTDEEIAQSVIEESDVICYVVTNDSIQETEFGFLKLLKEKAKPLIILLNVKNNLRDSRRLEYFLKDPDKLFAMDGKSGLGGHIQRIRRYAKQHYANDYFDVVPVLLLAAQMSREPSYKERKDKLFNASRIQNFLDSIRVSLVEHGVIRRSQTLLGSTVGAIDHPEKWVTKQAQVYEQLTNTLKQKRGIIQKDIQKAEKDASEFLRQQIETIFQDTLNAVPSFAEAHWNSNEINLKLGWEQKIKAIRFEERLKAVYQETSQKFNKDVQEALEEVGKELQLLAQLGVGNFTFTEQDSNNFRDLLRIGGSLLLIAGTIVGFFAPPVGIAIGIAAGVVSLITGLFKSKDEKRREAVQKISSSLVEQINKQKEATLQQAESSFNKSCIEVAMNINTYFEELIAGLESMSMQFQLAQSKLSDQANYLNHAYAKRILDWCMEQHEPLTDESINRNIAKVKRDFGKGMTIQTKSNFKLGKSQENIKLVLQEDISIMTQDTKTFNAATVGATFEKTLVKFEELLAQANKEEVTAIRTKLREELKAYREQGILSVAFVGQYSAGKSTIISALTGRRDIHIDADIATDKTSSYDWNAIKLIDTPGLFTDRKDHDDITYEAIAKADLLVFCLTYMLFDSVTAENFKKLAYEKGYRWKMMLLVNKMSDEAGEEEQKIANYRKSLAEALQTYSLNEFPICFIDAKDYCEGVDEEDDFLLEVSGFQTFIDALNSFIKRRAALTRFDTPVRIALTSVDEAQLSFTRNSTQDSTFFEVLTRLSRTVRKEREGLRTKVQAIVLEMSSAIAQEGITLAAPVGVGSKEEFEKLNKEAELNVQKHYEKAETKLQEAVNTAVEYIQQEVEGVLQSNLVKSFVACLDRSQNISAQNVDSGLDEERIKSQVNMLKSIGDTAGVSLTNLATRGFVKTASGQGFLRSIDVAGSSMHQGVVAVGKFVGFKFKPWQAVNIAKNIGNAAKFLGPALAIVSVGVDIHASLQERQREKEMADIRQEITSQFQAIAKDLENQVQIQLWEFERQVYGEIEKKIAEARQQEESAIAASNTWVKQLAEIRKDFELILRYITKATETPVA